MTMIKKNMHPTDQSLLAAFNRSYILRLWRVDRSKTADWRASLEILETGQRIGFASLEQLFSYLIDLSEGNGDNQQTINKGMEDGDE